MSEKLRILVTGFGPFPGAPYNPTQPLVARLTRLRRPAFTDVELSSHIFPVTYKAVDRELPLALAKHKPHAMLMFGLAGRTKYVQVEIRACNAVTMLWPDAAQTRVRKGSIADGADAQRFGPHTAKLLRAAVGVDGLDRASSDNCRDSFRHRARPAHRCRWPVAARSRFAVCGPNLMASAPVADRSLAHAGLRGVGPQHGDGVAGAGFDPDIRGAAGEAEHQQRVRPVFCQSQRQFAVDRLVGHRERCGWTVRRRRTQGGAAASAAPPAAASDCRARRETGRSR